MANPVQKPAGIDAGAETLLRDALGECDQVMDRLGNLLRLVDTLVAVLPPERRTFYLQSIARFQTVPRSGRRDAINDNIIAFIKEKQEATVSEVREALINQGLSVDQKRVANSLDYLCRRGQLERIGRGQYRTSLGDAAIEDILTEQFGPRTFRGHRPTSGDQLPPEY